MSSKSSTRSPLARASSQVRLTMCWKCCYPVGRVAGHYNAALYLGGERGIPHGGAGCSVDGELRGCWVVLLCCPTLPSNEQAC